MAIKNIVISDLSGQEVGEDQAATIVVTDHPNLSGAVELDVTKAEAEKLQSSKIDLVSVLVYDGGREPRRVVMAGKDFNALFKSGTDVDATLKGARPSQEKGAAKRGRRSSAPKGDRIDYTDPANAGMLHRGRVTDAEAEWVRANKEKASKNREKQTGSPIDFNDPAEKKRYGL